MQETAETRRDLHLFRLRIYVSKYFFASYNSDNWKQKDRISISFRY